MLEIYQYIPSPILGAMGAGGSGISVTSTSVVRRVDATLSIISHTCLSMRCRRFSAAQKGYDKAQVQEYIKMQAN